MGLDAVIYFSLDSLNGIEDKALLKIDDLTGEVYSDDRVVLSRLPSDFSVAMHERLGNVAEVAALRKECLKCLDESSILIGVILASGTHSGDIVPTGELARLSLELVTVERVQGDEISPEFTALSFTLRRLIQEAEKQGNPIVFV